jgi:hypothetical protein
VTDVRQEAATQARYVGEQAGEQARQVARTAKQETRTVLAEVRGSMRSQVDTQRTKAAQSLRSLGDEMREMASGRDDRFAGLMDEAAGRVQDASAWVETHEPSEVLRIVEDFARRRPGLFLASATLAGVVTGRLTRSLASGAGQHSGNGNGNGASSYGAYAPGAVGGTLQPMGVAAAVPPSDPALVDDLTVVDPVPPVESGTPFGTTREGAV